MSTFKALIIGAVGFLVSVSLMAFKMPVAGLALVLFASVCMAYGLFQVFFPKGGSLVLRIEQEPEKSVVDHQHHVHHHHHNYSYDHVTEETQTVRQLPDGSKVGVKTTRIWN